MHGLGRDDEVGFLNGLDMRRGCLFAASLGAGLALMAGPGVPLAPGQVEIQFDSIPPPSFSFGANPYASPFFTPELLGVDPGSTDYARLSDLADMAADTLTNFPPGMEFFTATWGNPAFVLQPTTRVAGTLPEGDSPFALAWRFGGGTARYGISGGRGMRTAAANPANARLDGKTYRLGQMMNVSPLVLDMDRDGALGASDGRWLPHPASLDGPYVRFDMDGDGYPDLTEWMTPGDALLCRTLTPSTARDFFGSIDGWPDGFARLAAEFDADTNGVIEGAERDGLFVWEDADGDAVPDAGEV